MPLKYTGFHIIIGKTKHISTGVVTNWKAQSHIHGIVWGTEHRGFQGPIREEVCLLVSRTLAAQEP